MSYTDELAKLIAEGLQKAKQGIDTSTNIERGKPSTMQTQTAQKTKYSSAHDMLLSMGTGGGTGDLFSTNVPPYQSIFEKHPKNTQVTPTGTVSGHTGNAGGIKSLIDFLAPAEHPAKDPSSVFNNYGKDIFQKQSEREAEKFFSSYKLKIPSGYENLLSDPNAYMMAYQQTKDAYVSLYAESARRTKELDYKLRGNLSDEERNVLTQKKQGEEFYRDALLLTSHYMPQSDKSLLDETKELMELRDGEEKKKRVEELKKQYDGIGVSFEKFGIKYTNFYNAQKRQEELNKPLETHYQELDALEEEYQHWLDTNDIDMSQHHLREQVYIIDDYGKKIAEKQKIIEEIEHYQNYTLVQKKKDFAQHAITLDDLWALYEHLNPTADADELSGIGTPGGVPMPGEPVGDTSTLPHEVQDKLPQIKKLLPYIEYLKNEEVGIYTYLYSTEGKKSAEEYFGSIKETINYRMAEDEYKRMSGIEKTLYFIPAGLEQFGSGFAQWFSDEKAPTSVTQFKSGMIREEAYDTWKGLGYLYDAGVTVSNMAPSIGLGFINPGLGVASLAVSAGGNAYGDALERGYSARGARLYGVLVGTSEAFLQKMLGGITKLGGAGNIPAKFATKADMIKNSFLRVSAKYGIQLGGEIIEEELQLFIEPALRSIIFDEDYEMPEAQEIIETAVVTAISTGVLESPQIAKSEISNAKYKDLFADSSTELIGKALDIDPTNGQVLEMQKRLAAGKELTGAELRKLVEIQAKHIRQTYERSKKTVSTQEEAVVNKIATDRIADAEKDGTKLSRKQKRDIRNQVMLELERGELSVDSIEGVLGGDAYTAYRKEADKQKALKEEYAELMGMRAADRTGYQDARMQELAKMNLEDTTKTDELRSRLDKAMSGQINGRLTESYRQRELRTKEFKADLNSYPENQRAIVQAAMDSGVLNNTHATHDFVNLVAKLCADKGIGFNFTNNEKLKATGFAIGGKIINGFVNADGITVNVNSAKALNTVVGHEITHVLEGTDLYDQLMQVAKKYTGKNWDAMRNRAEQTYAKRSSDGNILRDKDGNAVFVTDVNLDAEVLADFIGEALFTDEKFLKSLATGNRGLFKKLWDEVKYLCKVATAGSKEARQLEKVKKLFSKLYRDTQVEQKNTADPDGVKYSIGETSDNRPVAIVDSDILGSMDLSTWDDTKKEQAKKAAKDALLNFKDGIYVHGVNYSVTRKSRREFTRSEYTAALYNHNQSTFADKMKTAPYLDDVVLATTQWSQDGKLTHLRKDNFIDFLHGNVLIKAIDNMYSAQVVVGITKNGQYVFYDLVDMKPTSFDIKKEPPTTVSSNNTLNDIHGDSFGNNIAPGAKDVNNKFSLSDPAEVEYSADEGSISKEEWDSILSRNDESISEEEWDSILSQDSASSGAYANVQTVQDRIKAQMENAQKAIDNIRTHRNETVKRLEEKIESKQKEYDRKKNKDTKVANHILQQIEDLRRRVNDIEADYESKAFKLRKRIEKLQTPEYERFVHRKQKADQYRQESSDRMGDTSTWVDKKLGLFYKVNTIRRNLRYIVRDENGKPDIQKADAIFQYLQGDYNTHEALLKLESRSIKTPFAKMNIGKHESVYIQMLGELRHNPDCELSPDSVNEYYEKHKKDIDTQKVDQAIEMAREVYDTLLQRVNHVLREHGMKEIPYRKGYFPHFTMDKQGFLGKLLNWKTKNDDIPTDIAGMTEAFKPVRSWQSFSKERTTDTTDYNFLKGLDTYVHGALDWIHHIEDIERRRAFEAEIRYRHSEQGIKDKVDQIRNNPDLSAEEVEVLIDNAYKESKNPLNNFVTDLRDSTNNLAAKKSANDREMEKAVNRKVYSTMTNISNRVSSNMIAGSISSALTNFIPIVQSWGQVSPWSSIKALKQVVTNAFRNDGMIEKSAFMTNRLIPEENLYKSFWDKTGEKLGVMMELVDKISTETVWRSKYIENINAGMSENEAIHNADLFAEGVMAGRSRGNMPTIFNAKNIVTRTFTAFQLEVKNQYGYMLKDMPADVGKKHVAKLTWGYAKLFAGAFAYNALYSALTGRDAAFDPVGIVKEFVEDLISDDDDDEDNLFDALEGLGKNAVQEIPFIGGLLGGGRIPISSALPDMGTIWEGIKVFSTSDDKEQIEQYKDKFINELSKPLTYLVMPMGGGQLSKTWRGLKMFLDPDHPVSGSYTDSGNMRYPVEETPWNIAQAVLFGQYASDNAREYFDEGYDAMNAEEIAEYKALGLDISDYWNYRESVKDFKRFVSEMSDAAKEEGATTEDALKSKYLSAVKNEIEALYKDQKEVLGSDLYSDGHKEGHAYRTKTFTEDLIRDAMQDHQSTHISGNYGRVGDYHFRMNANGEWDKLEDDQVDKMKTVTAALRITPKEYYRSSEATSAYKWAYEHQDEYAVSRAVTDDIVKYKKYTSDISKIKEDEHRSRKHKVADYINSLDLDYGARIILFRTFYPGDDRYNYDIVEYLNDREEFSYGDIKRILEKLGMQVTEDGKVHW